MPRLRQTLAKSSHPAARGVRAMYHAATHFSLPAPKVIFKPILLVFIWLRSFWHEFRRIFICEPLFKAYCRSYGKRLRTDIYIHWVQGQGDILCGDDVLVDGKCSFAFAARFADRPTIVIGDRTGIGHNGSFTVARRIEIGADCMIASDVWMFDSPGHPADVAGRKAGLPPLEKDIRPIKIGDNVWIGRRCIIFPGVTIGDGCIISAGSVVMQDIPANTIAAGNPARKVGMVPAAAPVEAAQPPAGAQVKVVEQVVNDRSVSVGG